MMLVEADLPNSDGALYPGMYGTMSLTVNVPSSAPLVTDDALIFRDGKVFVPVVRNSVVHLAPVTLGYDNGYAVEATSGISMDDLIALNLGQSATEGERVQPIQQTADAKRTEELIMIEPGLIQNAAAVGAAFAASLVECVEALTIVLAVSSVSGWRSGLLGAACGAVLLAATVALAGGALVRVPLNDLHVLVGVVLLVFGLSWLRKAVLRTAGMKAKRDEAAIYSQQIEEMRSQLYPGFGDGLDFLAMTAAFKAVVIEGVEVVFIVVTVGHMAAALVPAALGAAAAAIVVVALGFAIHRPLTRVPENALKFGVGVVIVSFGIFWLGEGLGLGVARRRSGRSSRSSRAYSCSPICARRATAGKMRRIRHDAPPMPHAEVVRSSSRQL